MANYTSSDAVKRLAGVKTNTNTNNDTLISEMLSRVDAIIDRATGTYFRQAGTTLIPQVYWIRPVKEGMQKIYLPAPIISISSVTELGATLGATSYIIGGNKDFNYYIEKWSGISGQSTGASWSTSPYSDGTALREPVKVSGVFGYATVPYDIEQFATELCAILSGLKTKTFMTSEGIQQTVNVTSAPEYAKQLLANRQWMMPLSGQIIHA